MSGPPLVVLQARAGSTRLPGKVLADVGGMPMLEFQLRRLLPIRSLLDATVVVATSDLHGDDPVAALAEGLGIEAVRGSEQDVLGRYALALETHPADTVVRLTGDCPLNDPELIRAVVDLHLASRADYTSNVLPRTFPKGLDVEVVAASALATADREAEDRPDREHVMPYLYRRPERFRLANLHTEHALGEERWTVDTAADLERIREIVAALADPLGATWEDILATVGTAPVTEPPAVALRPQGSALPGSSPWPRTWSAVADGRDVGMVTVTVGDGTVQRTVDVGEPWHDAAEAALDRLLLGDLQSELRGER